MKVETNPIALAIFLLIGLCHPLFAQVPFTCQGQVWCVVEDTNEFAELAINPSNNAVDYQVISSLGDLDVKALAFRSTDRLVYALESTTHELYQIDANGQLFSLGILALEAGLRYDAAGIDPGGQFLYATGSQNQSDLHMVRVDLNTFDVEFLPVAGGIYLLDIAFDPYTGDLWAYDFNNTSFLKIELPGLTYTGLAFTDNAHTIEGVFFDAIGQPNGYGTSANGFAGASFSVNKATGQETRSSNSGPVIEVTDLAACPYGVDFFAAVEPEIVLPCTEADYTYLIGNGSGVNQTGVQFEHDFPAGFDVIDVIRNPYGGTVSVAAGSLVRIDNITLDSGVDSIIVRVEVGDLPGGDYPSQASLDDLSMALGEVRHSDDPASIAPVDPTLVRVNRIDEDSVFNTRFVCIGDQEELDASDFGENISWNTGSNATTLNVTEQGLYSLTATSGCQSVYVEYEVTFASCPYTIEMRHENEPSEAFPCSENLYRFYIENASGLPRAGVFFTDTLPEGMELIAIQRNPFGGTLLNDPSPRVIRIEDMFLPVGEDTLDILVAIGDLQPGNYPNRARIDGLSIELGPFRWSDDPGTQESDSTFLEVLGVPIDSLLLDTVICARQTITLSAAPYGRNVLWDNGSTDSILVITEPGFYQVTILDGCEPAYVFFDVQEGPPIDLTVEDEVTVFLGESHEFDASVLNFGDTTIVQWIAAVDSTLSCLDCLDPIARPLRTTEYTLRVANEICTDSVLIEFIVDNTRRIYAPNVFSPNLDGLNDYFYLQSPDFGRIRKLLVFDRWGNQVFTSSTSELNTPWTGWDGRAAGQFMPAGVYIWQAEIEFLDGLIEIFSGDIGVLR